MYNRLQTIIFRMYGEKQKQKRGKTPFFGLDFNYRQIPTLKKKLTAVLNSRLKKTINLH